MKTSLLFQEPCPRYVSVLLVEGMADERGETWIWPWNRVSDCNRKTFTEDGDRLPFSTVYLKTARKSVRHLFKAMQYWTWSRPRLRSLKPLQKIQRTVAIRCAWNLSEKLIASGTFPVFLNQTNCTGEFENSSRRLAVHLADLNLLHVEIGLCVQEMNVAWFSFTLR